MSFSGSYTTPTDKPEPEPAEAPDAKRGPDSGSAHATQLRADEDPGQLKRLSAETWWNYSPVNSTEFGVQNILKFQIPTTDVIFDMSRAFITVDYLMPVGIYRVLEDGHDTDHGYRQYVSADEDRAKIMAKYFGQTSASGYALPADGQDYPVIMNSATIFNVAEMAMDGNVIYHNDYVQTQARLWQLNKNDEWIDSQPQTFFRPSRDDIDNFASNNQMGFFRLDFKEENRAPANVCGRTALQGFNDAMSSYYYQRRQLKIPLVALFPQFEVMNGWPSFLVKQILFLQLTVSNVKKYLCSMFGGNNPADGPYSVCDIASRDNLKLSIGTETEVKPVSSSDNPVFRYKTCNLLIYDEVDPGKKEGEEEGEEEDEPSETAKRPVFDDDELAIDVEFKISELSLENATLYLPSHIPEFKERAEYEALVNSGLTYGFKSYHILSNSANLEQNNNVLTKSLTYNSSVNNLEAINLLFLRDGTEVLFDKPGISSIQCNLGNSWQLAASGTHIENLYRRDSNFLTDLCKGWGQADKSYMQTVSEDVIRSFKFNSRMATLVPKASGRPLTWNNDSSLYKAYNYGAYTLYFDASPGDELGVAAGQYSRLIALRFNVDLPEGVAAGIASRTNYAACKIYVCQQTFSTITITPGAVFIANPFAEEYDAGSNSVITKYRNLNYSESGLRTHGLTVTHGLGSELIELGKGILKEKVIPLAQQKLNQKLEEVKQPGGFRGLMKRIGQRFKRWFGKRTHGYLPLKAMRVLGPAGYKRFHHRIQKWDAAGLTGSERRKLLYHLGRKWDHDPTNPDRGHGTYKQFFERRNRIPGAHIRRFEDESLERVRPNIFRGGAQRPPRLHPFGRFFTSIPASHGDLMCKHGLTSPYHGWLREKLHRLKEWIKEKIPGKIRKVMEVLGPIAKRLAPEALAWAKNHPSLAPAIARGEMIWNKAKGIFEKVDNKTTQLIQGTAPGAQNSVEAEHGRRVRHYLKSLPHSKRMYRFYKKHYARQHGRSLLKLEKAFWKAGDKRMADGLY